MFVTYRRIVNIPLLPALAATGAVVIVCGLAVTMLVVVAIVTGGKALLRMFGLHEPQRRADTIEATVVNRSSAGILDQ